MFCYAQRCVHSSCAIILKRKRELVALILLSYGCLVAVGVLSVTLPRCAVGWSAACDKWPLNSMMANKIGETCWFYDFIYEKKMN